MKHTQVIDGVTYSTVTLPATKGLRILPKLIALFGEPILKLMFALAEKKIDEEGRELLMRDPKVMGGILASMAANAADGDGLLVVKDLLVTTTADKIRIGTAEPIEQSAHAHFDTHFAGRYGHLANVAIWVATVNFIGP